MKKIYKIGLATTSAIIVVFSLLTISTSLKSNVLRDQIQTASFITTNIPEEHIPHYLRVKNLSSCKAGYAFLARWATLAQSFNEASGVNDKNISDLSSGMFALAANKYEILENVILKVTKIGVEAGANPTQLQNIQEGEFKKIVATLNEAFLLVSLTSPEAVLKFFEIIMESDVACQKLVADISSNADLESDYYKEKNNKKDGWVIKYQNQR